MCTQSSYVKVCVAKTQQLSGLCGVSLFFSSSFRFKKRLRCLRRLLLFLACHATEEDRVFFWRPKRVTEQTSRKKKKEEKNVCYARALRSSNLATVQRGGGGDDDCQRYRKTSDVDDDFSGRLRYFLQR